METQIYLFDDGYQSNLEICVIVTTRGRPTNSV